MLWYVIEFVFFIYNLIIDKVFFVKFLGWLIIVISDLLDVLNVNVVIKGFWLDIENVVGIDFNYFLCFGFIGKLSCWWVLFVIYFFLIEKVCIIFFIVFFSMFLL